MALTAHLSPGHLPSIGHVSQVALKEFSEIEYPLIASNSVCLNTKLSLPIRNALTTASSLQSSWLGPLA